MTEPLDYATCPLEQLSVKDLTDALGISESAELLNTSARAIYTVRNTSALSADRMLKLIAAVRADEENCRRRLVVTRRLQAERERRAEAA
jgi:hypothetical protein